MQSLPTPSSPRAITTHRIAGVTLLVALFAGGCTQAPTVDSAWAEGASRGGAFSRVLVVGVSHNLKTRCAFERYLAGQIGSDSTEAFTSCDSIDKDAREPLTRESIEQAVAARKADAVIATVLVTSDMQAVQGGGRDTRGTAGYKATDAGWWDGYYGVYGVPVVYGEFKSTSEITTIQADVTVGTRVFETRGANVVYTLETRARHLESRAEGLSAITGPIAERLRRDGVIR
jgi:hypothetical protein